MNDELQDYSTNNHLSLFYDEPNTTHNQLIENVKIFDGFYLGNVYAGGDQEFLNNNKIGLIINCQPLELKIEAIPFVDVLTYNFHTRRGQIQESLHMAAFTEIVSTIHDFLSNRNEGVLMLSIRIDSRSLCLAIGYLMVKYAWSLEETFHFLKKKKQNIEIADKYTEILKNLQRSPQRIKLIHIFTGVQTKQQSILLKNTRINSQTTIMPNFHGLCYKRDPVQASPVQDTPKNIKFIDTIQQIRTQTPPTSEAEKQQSLLTLTKQVQTSTIGQILKEDIKLNSAQLKLKRFIKQKCNPNHFSGHIEPRVGLQLPSEEPLTSIKAKDKVGKRRAASRTEKSVAYDQQQPFTRVKRNNFLSQNIKNKIAGVQQLFQKKIMSEESTEKSRLKISSEYLSKSQLSKRWQTDITQSAEYPPQDTSKINNMFKISKSNKSSHKKIRSDQPYRGKGYLLRPHQKNLKASNSTATASHTTFIAQTSFKLNQKKMSADGKPNPARESSNCRVDHHTADQNYQQEEHLREEKKQINKLKCRVLPKRLVKKGTFQ